MQPISKSSASSFTATPTSSATRSGAPYSKDTLGDDFRDIRIAAFGERDKRTLADFRRSGAHEAIAGEATPAALAHAMGNTLSASNALFATYCPVNLATIRSVMEARRRGRPHPQTERMMVKSRNAPGEKLEQEMDH